MRTRPIFVQLRRHPVELVGQRFDFIPRFHFDLVLKLACGHLFSGMDEFLDG